MKLVRWIFRAYFVFTMILGALIVGFGYFRQRGSAMAFGAVIIFLGLLALIHFWKDDDTL